MDANEKKIFGAAEKKTIDLKCVVPIDMNYSTAICLPQSHEKMP
jgi:hypothetical protein